MVREESCTSYAKSCKGKGSMSICLCLFDSDEIYFASDSRSSVARDIAQPSGFVIESEVVSDEYQKIVDFTANGKQYVAVSTGRNTFGLLARSISEMILQTNFDSCDTIWKTSIALYQKFCDYHRVGDSEMTLSLFCYEGEDLCESRLNFDDRAHPATIKKHIQPVNASVEYIIVGVDWCTSVVKFHQFPIVKSNEETYVKSINEFFNKATKISSVLECSVGGPVQIAKLTPDSFRWIQKIMAR